MHLVRYYSAYANRTRRRLAEAGDALAGDGAPDLETRSDPDEFLPRDLSFEDPPSPPPGSAAALRLQAWAPGEARVKTQQRVHLEHPGTHPYPWQDAPSCARDAVLFTRHASCAHVGTKAPSVTVLYSVGDELEGFWRGTRVANG